jgi:hypothetical protein
LSLCKNCGQQIEEADRCCKFCGADQYATPINPTVPPISSENALEKLFKQTTPTQLLQYLDTYKDVIPNNIVNKARQVITTGKADNPDEAVIMLNEVVKITRNYISMMKSPIGSIPDEQTLWIREETKGTFKKVKVKTWGITNKRVYLFNHQTQKFFACGLIIMDTLVMNTQRISNGNRVGNYVGVKGIGTSYSSVQSNSETYGDLVFLIQGKEIIRLFGISDPQGVKRLIDTVKKQQKV